MYSFLNRYALAALIHSMVLSSICLPVYADSSTAIFYGRPVPVNLLSHFKQVIVDAENMAEVDYLNDQGTRVFAYVSVSEVSWTRPWYSEIPKSWLLGSNKEWGSSVIDMTQQGWHDYLINKYLSGLWEKGYRGFFLDGLESYQRLVADPDDRLVQEQALSNLIKRIHEHFPGASLIVNRGFAILPQVNQYV